jgi:DNA polymerase I-like protein with 3'-5' exonuclease and polymerase domains
MGRRGFTIVRTPFPVYVATKAEAEKWAKKIRKTAQDVGFGYDTETTGLDIVRDRIKFFSVAQSDFRICGPVRLLPVFQDLLEDENVPKRMSNAKYDMHLTHNHGILIRGRVTDTIDQDFLYDENRQGRHGLKATAADHLGLKMTPFKKLFGNVGSVDKEVETLCEVHDILELHDAEGLVDLAEREAVKMLIRLNKVKADPDFLKQLQWLDKVIRAGMPSQPAKLSSPNYPAARKLLKIARDYGLAETTAGRLGYVSDFSRLIGGPTLRDLEDRSKWVKLLSDEGTVVDAYHYVWEELVNRITLNETAVQQLRLMVTDYASLDAWASFSLTDELRELLSFEDMPVEDQDDLAGAFEECLELLEEAQDADEDGVDPERIEKLLDDTEARLKSVEARAEAKEEPRTLLDFSENERTDFIRTLWNMERRGLRIRVDQCLDYADEMQEEIDRIEREIVKETRDVEFNPNSPKQLQDRLFEQTPTGEWKDPFGDKPKKMTKGGQTGVKAPSTGKDVLEQFAGKGHALSKLILELRGFSKLKGTYMDGLPQWVDRNHRIHTTLKSTGARTWRLSSADPNLQNIPARDEIWGPRIRKLFVAGQWGDCDPEWCMPHLRNVPVPRLDRDHPMTLIVADYEQLEMRIMAHFSRDMGMIEAIYKNRDLHCQTVYLASEIGAIERGITYDMAIAAKRAKEPTDEQKHLLHHRSNLKSTGFGIIYGIGALKLGMQLGLPLMKKAMRNGQMRDTCPAAQKLIDDYLGGIYPGVGDFIEYTHERCYEELLVRTLIGHPRRLPDIRSRDRGLAAQAERQSVNSIIQGTAVDITNLAMLRCEADEELRRLGVRLLLQIHDELVFEAPKDPKYIEPAKARIRELMEDPYDMLVPIEIGMDTADSWGDAK